jgi:hypothetical protein
VDELLEAIGNFLTWKVAAGFENDEEVVDRAVEAFEDQMGRPELQRLIAPIAAGLIEDHRRTEASWPETTDCDRLDMAFAELEHHGILARQDYWCCSTCGHSAAWGEVEREQAKRPINGYVFYHSQDTEGAVYGSFYLAYGAVEDSESALRRVAMAIIDTLRRFGITTEWNGQTNSRILVKDFDWKRRRRFGPAA